VHKVTVAKQVLRGYEPSSDLWPSEHLPKKLAAARAKYAAYLEDDE
jgi:acyl-CoA dehydrogenase